MRPTAFLVNVASFWTTSIETLWPVALIFAIISAPVANSAAMPWTAQNMDLNGFLLNHDRRTVVVALSDVNWRKRTPHQ